MSSVEKEKEEEAGGWRFQVLNLVEEGCGRGEPSKDQTGLETYQEEKLSCLKRHRQGELFTQELCKAMEEDSNRYKGVFAKIHLGRKAAAATEAWRSLPKKPKNKERKVVVMDVNAARDVWYYEEDERPEMNIRKWRAVMRDMLETVEWREKLKSWNAEDPNSYDYQMRKMLMII